MRTKVVVLGHNYATKLCVIRALGQAGYDVALVSFAWKRWYAKPIEAWSKYVSEFYYCSDTDAVKLADFLISTFANKDSKSILLPTSDLSASLVDMEYERLSPYFLLPNVSGKHQGILELMDKEGQKKLAIDSGLNVAITHFLSRNSDTFNITEDINYPCFPKPAASVSGGKNGMCRCNTKEELQAQLNVLAANGASKVAVEDYLKIDREFAVVGCTDGNTVVIPGVLHLKEMTHGSHFGVAMAGELIPNSEFGTFIDELKMFVRCTGYKGLFDIDFFDCQGKYYFGELNLRPGASIGAYTNQGINLPALFVDTMIGRALPTLNINVIERSTFINDRSCILEWMGGFLSLHQMLTRVAKTNGFVRSNDDKMPMLPFWCDLIKEIIKNIIKR